MEWVTIGLPIPNHIHFSNLELQEGTTYLGTDTPRWEFLLVHREENTAMVHWTIIQHLTVSLSRACAVAPHNLFPHFREELMRIDLNSFSYCSVIKPEVCICFQKSSFELISSAGTRYNSAQKCLSYLTSCAKLVFGTQPPSCSHRTKLAALRFKPDRMRQLGISLLISLEVLVPKYISKKYF